ncbi:MAG: FmdB family zinc ribbon protein [Endomicrobiales bacterium]
MPIYEYACTECAHRFEELQEMNDKPKDKCPVCGKPVRRLMSAATPIMAKGKCSERSCCGGETQCGGGMPSCHGGKCGE